MSKSSLEAAAEAAAKVNAMLIAKGKLKLSPSQIKPKIGNNLSGRPKAIGDLITAEVDINDAPLSARNLLTRGHMQDEICKLSGAAISTRGRYMTPEERQSIATPECRPLYLNVQASSYDAVKVAVRRIQEIIDQHVQMSGIPKSPTVGVVTYPATSTNGSFGLTQSMSTSHLPVGSHFVQDKVFVGLEQAPPDYPVREKILGPGGSFLQHIRTETGATVTLRGKGSGFIEPTSGREAFEPLYIHITHPKPEGLQAAKALAVNLIETAHVEFAQWQQAQQTILQPLTSIVLPQATSVAYQNQVMMTPAVLPVTPNALSTGTGVVTAGIQIPASVAAGNTLASGIPNLMHASVPTLVAPVAPVSVMSSVPVSVQGIPSPTVITYPTYVANTNPVLARPANAVLGRPAVPAVSIIGVLPTMPAAATYTATQPRAPFPNQQQLPYTQPVGYASVPAPQQTNLTQASVSPTSMVMTVSDTANYPVATRFTVPVPEVQQEADVAKHRFYNGMEGPKAHPQIEPSPCLQESNVNHPTELATRRGAMKRPSEDRDLMPPPQTIVPTPLTPVNSEEEAVPVDQILRDRLYEKGKEKFERHLALLRAYNIYKTEFSSPAEDDESVWEKIAGTVRISCSFNHWTINDCRLQLSQMKDKYEKKKQDWHPVSRPEANVLFEEEKLAFKTVKYPAIPVDRNLHDRLSEKGKEKFERCLALLRAYNIYKAEFSSPNEDDESVWGKIAGTVRISCSFNHWTINDCRLELSQMKENYVKKKQDWRHLSRSEADILFQEEKLAFETVGYPDRKKEKNVRDESLGSEKKKLKGALGGLASMYGSDDSDENDDDAPPSPTAKRK